jgi:hypothetical protein
MSGVTQTASVSTPNHTTAGTSVVQVASTSK